MTVNQSKRQPKDLKEIEGENWATKLLGVVSGLGTWGPFLIREIPAPSQIYAESSFFTNNTLYLLNVDLT